MARYDGAGRLDSSFGTGGFVTTDFSGTHSDDVAYGLVVLPNGDVVAAGYAVSYTTREDFGLARYDGGPLQLSDMTRLRSPTSSSPWRQTVSAVRPVDRRSRSRRRPTRRSTRRLPRSTACPRRVRDDGHGEPRPRRPDDHDRHPHQRPGRGGRADLVNGTLVSGPPALIVDSGSVVLDHVTAINATDAPTILVNGGT